MCPFFLAKPTREKIKIIINSWDKLPHSTATKTGMFFHFYLYRRSTSIQAVIYTLSVAEIYIQTAYSLVADALINAKSGNLQAGE